MTTPTPTPMPTPTPSPMPPDHLLGLLQFSDGLFPAGAYAHSLGLEWYVQAGLTRDASGLSAFIAGHLQAAAAPGDAAAVKIVRLDPHRAFELDAQLEAFKPARELREASRQMGRQTLRVACQLAADPPLQDFYAAVAAGATPGHHAVALGLVGAALGWPTSELVTAYLYAAAAALANAALRLMPLGQLAGQRVLWELQPLILRLVQDLSGDLGGFAPALEIAAMRHETLEARLFRS